MPTLEWIGKEKVINHHQEVPFRVLERQYTYGAEDSENMIIRGDNLEALKALLPRYEGRVKCIYIDPPYNTGNEGWVYNDNVNDPTNLWQYSDVGHTDEAAKILKAIFNGNATFDTPKPPRLVERILQIAGDKDALILDSFAGSGTTAHAVLNMNKADGGNRKFILVEMMDYADSITAERVKRVIDGYGQGKNTVEGTGGSFRAIPHRRDATKT